MNKEELKQKCEERAKIFQQAMESCHSSNPMDCIEWFADRIAELEKENAELKADNDARKFAMTMSEKVEKQLREENAELKWERDTKTELAEHLGKANNKVADLEETINKLREQLALRYDLEDRIKKLEEASKSNEWHYPSKGEYPDNDNDILCQIDFETFEVGYFNEMYNNFFTIDGKEINVKAWKEIVLPKESE